MPIDTAPKNGKLVLLYGAGYMRPGYFNEEAQIRNYPDWRWGLTIEPTHWMPLPPPPNRRRDNL